MARATIIGNSKLGDGAMILFYMNQGGGGNWGAVPYGDYNLLCLAENEIVKGGFKESYKNQAQPPMSVQVRADKSLRVISDIKDIDLTLTTVRPMLFFQISENGVRVIFVHLKSGDQKLANLALQKAVEWAKANLHGTEPVLWVGDFNRANDLTSLSGLHGYVKVMEGGGQALWNLDRVIVTGDWSKIDISAKQVTKAGGDHDHLGIAITIESKAMSDD